jgi:micrococcal nuclease
MRPEKGTATNIVSGDIIDVNIDGALYRVRYIGMDTPEWGDPYFEEARNYNAQLVAGQTVRLVKDVSDMDRFGRLLRYVYLPNGTFVNGELVRQGYALTETYPPDLSHSATFASLEQEAQEAGRGIWGVQAATPAESPSPTEPRPTAEPTSTPKIVPGDIEIIDIHYDGSVGEDECDEYAEVTNFSRSPVSIEGWRLNAGDLRQVFVFPDFDLQPGQSCRVYTNEVHQQTCGFSFGLGHEIWDNGGECGHLYDSAGNEVSRYCY